MELKEYHFTDNYFLTFLTQQPAGAKDNLKKCQNMRRVFFFFSIRLFIILLFVIALFLSISKYESQFTAGVAP